MTDRTIETSPKFYARIGGFLYLIVIVLGIFAEVFVRGQLVVYRDPATTASNILAHEMLYRMGFAAGVTYLLCNIPLTLILYRLFKPVNRDLSLLFGIFVLVATAIEGASLLGHFASLVILKSGHFLNAFSPDQLQALAYIPLRLQSVGFDISLAFCAFYCLSIGILIIRSTFFPRILGVFYAIAGLCYLTNSFTNFLAPQYSLFPFILMPCLLAELSFCLWLIVKGVNVQRWKEQARAAGGWAGGVVLN